MKIAIYSRNDSPHIESFTKIVESLGVEYIINPCQASDCDIAVSLGGDGTFLSSVRKMGINTRPLLGINYGRLGFLATVPKEQAAEAIKSIKAGCFEVQHRLMLEVEGPIPTPNLTAVNEFTLQKRCTSMISITIEIDGRSVADYWADGVIISTPTGSTAYSMSVGGAILTPGCRCFIISPIAPHNLNIRPLVVPDTSLIQIAGSSRTGNSLTATIDNREYEVAGGERFTVQRSPRTLDVIKLSGSSFYKTIRDKLLWGIDARN